MNEEYAGAVRAAFREEAQDLLKELEAGLLGLEVAPEDPELVGRIFRALHTLKGSGGMAGFDEVAEFTHRVESLFELVRSGAVRVDDEIIDIGLSSKDLIAAMLEGTQAEAAERAAREIGERVARRCAVAGLPERSSPSGPEGQTPSVGAGAEGPAPPATYRIRFKPPRDLFRRGIDPLHLLRELKGLGDCAIIARTGDLPDLATLDPELCYLSWDVVLTTERGLNAVKDVFIFVADSSELRIEDITEETRLSPQVRAKRLGEILVERGDLSADTLDRVLSERGPLGEGLVSRGLVREEDVTAALIEQEQVRKAAERAQPASSTQSIRVRSEKLDSLVDLVGELVTAQAGLSQLAERAELPELASIAEKVERLAADLRETAMSMRMVPIGGSFGRLTRLVRDLARQLGKEAELATSGEETELDKTVIERLGDPLIHLIRNAMDHGIESPQARELAGKPRSGTIRLDSAQSGGFVYITIADDGAGLDQERILARAIQRGIVAADAALSKREIFELIFLPGFSTASSLTEISGRGVGMDVVRSTIESLRGEVSVASERGKGTQVTLKIPLTLAIIEGLLVAVDGEHFVVPLSAVNECAEYTARDRALEGASEVKRLHEVRGSLLPVVNLRRLFSIETERPAIEQVVIAEVDGRRAGFLVDTVIGSYQIVIKNLGSVYRTIDGFSGATILGDGTMALILDLGRLVQRAESSEQPWARRAAMKALGTVG